MKFLRISHTQLAFPQLQPLVDTVEVRKTFPRGVKPVTKSHDESHGIKVCVWLGLYWQSGDDLFRGQQVLCMHTSQSTTLLIETDLYQGS